jgi:hypothetical protein
LKGGEELRGELAEAVVEEVVGEQGEVVGRWLDRYVWVAEGLVQYRVGSEELATQARGPVLP